MTAGGARGFPIFGGEARHLPRAPADLARELREQREALRSFEGAALAGVAESLEVQRQEEWMGAEQAASYLGMTPRAFKRIAPHLPRRYVSSQVILYPRSLIDEALYAAESPEEPIVGVCRHDDKSTRSARSEAIPRPPSPSGRP